MKKGRPDPVLHGKMRIWAVPDPEGRVSEPGYLFGWSWSRHSGPAPVSVLA